MSTRNRILVPMIVLTIVGSISVLISSVLLFRRETNDSMINHISLASTVLEYETGELKRKAELAAHGIATNPDLIQALIDNDRDAIIQISNSLRVISQIDFCNVLDNKGVVISRTHAPDISGDNISNQPHVAMALRGESTSFFTQGAVIRLGAYAGAPVYDSEMNLIGVISLGFRLDTQDFVYKIKDLTECEVSIFLHDERVSTTLLNEEGTYAIGTQAPEDIFETVSSGRIYTGFVSLFGNRMISRYIPLYGVGNNVIGMISVGYETSEYDEKLTVFVVSGIFLATVVLVICIALALFISDLVNDQLMKRERELALTQDVLRQARDVAESANRSKSVFLANMSHEIRTPMNSIIGFSELAQDDNISARTRQYLSNISENALWLLDIINDILDNTKIESGKIVLEHIPFDLQEVITQCQSAILPKTADKGFSLFCYTDPLKGKKVMGDPVRLRQVLMNLLSNSIKFTSKGYVKLLAPTKTVTDTHATIKFEVRDSGIGMTPDHVAYIFEPYVQADDSVTRKFGGTGLGLPISKSIVELMGGELLVDSVPGVGSTFSFELTFDLVNDADVHPSQTVILGNTEKPYFDSEILICEDNFLNQQVICDHLSRVGIRTIVAFDGQEGVNIVEERVKSGAKPFDLIFMDIHMPIMDGLEAAEKIAGLGVETPIVALTANIMSSDLELYREYGMKDCLGKPFTSQDLWKCLLKYLTVTSYVTESKQQLLEEEDKALTQLRVYFVESNQTVFAQIMDALDAGNSKLAHRLIHTLKSNAGQIGEKQLQKAAAEAETILSDGEFQLTYQHTHAIEVELKEVLGKLAPLAEKEHSEEKVITTDKDRIKEIIGKLEPVLKLHSTECMSMLDEIRTLPDAEELTGYVEDFEFKKAIVELDELKKKLGME